MNSVEKPGISYLAIFSLVLGMLFLVPIATGAISVILGILALRKISKADGALLGKGLAYSGIVLGAIHGTFWILVAYAGLTYTIDVAESAVVIRDREVVRVEHVGVHFKVPFFESVEVFPTEELQELEASTGPLLFANRDSHTIKYNALWRVCNPEKAYLHYRMYDIRRMKTDIEFDIKMELRMSAVRHDGLSELLGDYQGISTMEEKINNSLSSKGVCMVSLWILSEEISHNNGN